MCSCVNCISCRRMRWGFVLFTAVAQGLAKTMGSTNMRQACGLSLVIAQEPVGLELREGPSSWEPQTSQ